MADQNPDRCPLGRQNHSEIENLKVSDERQWRIIESLQNRLPAWATILIGILMGLLGVLLTVSLAHNDTPQNQRSITEMRARN